jgi:outer membrane protein
MNKLKMILPAALALLVANVGVADDTNSPAWLTRPLSLADALNTALIQNATILKAKNDLEASQGLVIQTRAVALPQVTATGQYQKTDASAIENFPGVMQPDQNWNTAIQIVQTIYDGGRSIAALQAAGATKKQAIAVYQTAVSDTLLQVRLSYYDVLLAGQQIIVNEASVKLLEKELEDQQHRLDAGTVPKFNVLQAEVAVANERPALIQARNSFRIAKNNLANLLGYDLPHDVWEDIPLNLTDGFNITPLDVNLPDAIQQALQKRTELESLRRTVDLEKLGVVSARSGYQPTVSVFAGYDWFNAKFTPPVTLDHDIRGWNAGAQLNWDIFDGALTYGKVKQARRSMNIPRTTWSTSSGRSNWPCARRIPIWCRRARRSTHRRKSRKKRKKPCEKRRPAPRPAPAPNWMC